jgi:hypothetical protein
MRVGKQAAGAQPGVCEYWAFPETPGPSIAPQAGPILARNA